MPDALDRAHRFAGGAADLAAAGWISAVSRFADATPAGWYLERGGAGAVLSGTAIASLNTAVDLDTTPDLAALGDAATLIAGCARPWSITVRDGAADAVADLAARHGLVVRSELPMMVCAADEAVLDVADLPHRMVHRVDSSASAVYTSALAEGFGVAEESFGPLMDGGVLDAPGFAGYLATDSGRAVGCGLGITGDRTVGVFNIAVAPDCRGRGLGRALTARVMADGFAAGAGTAFLIPSEAGLPLYESMGFRVVDRWALFTAS